MAVNFKQVVKKLKTFGRSGRENSLKITGVRQLLKITSVSAVFAGVVKLFM